MRFFKERYRKARDIRPGDVLITSFLECRVLQVTLRESGLVSVECTDYFFNTNGTDKYKVRRK